MISAIEIYNKPDYKYREETFAVLALNAWELLLKAFVLDQSDNDMRSLYVYEFRKRADGTRGRRKYIKRNRSGNALTIGMTRTIGIIEANGWHRFDEALKANLDGMMEVRDNAVHFSNEHIGFSKVVQELGTASIHNYVQVINAWFEVDLSEYNFYLMPLAFFRSFRDAVGVALNTEEKKFVSLLAQLQSEHHRDPDEMFSVLVELDVGLKRTTTTSGVRLAVGDDPEAIPITLSEEEIRREYPWDYADLTKVLRERYSDFKANQEYHDIRKPLKQKRQYVLQRYLDPGNPRSAKKDFYSPNILNEFDRHYERDVTGENGDDA